MHQFGAFEGKNNFGKLLDLAEAGEEVIITRHGRPVATISGTTQRTPEQVALARAAAERIRKRASEAKRGPFIWEEWKAYRDEGRR
jgi:antitoxin (DNA-binding transcriptional repressor) of toxin-antitoxin stability system